MTITATHTSTYTVTEFADPYKVCEQCGGWVDGVLDAPGPLIVVPCEHKSDYRSICPSWGPVDGCQCERYGLPHHEHRTNVPTGKVA